MSTKDLRTEGNERKVHLAVQRVLVFKRSSPFVGSSNLVLLILILHTSVSFGQDIPARWDELNARQWPLAMEKSSKTIILPIGILEKHGPHAPMGSDLIHVRNWVQERQKRNML